MAFVSSTQFSLVLSLSSGVQVDTSGPNNTCPCEIRHTQQYETRQHLHAFQHAVTCTAHHLQEPKEHCSIQLHHHRVEQRYRASAGTNPISTLDPSRGTPRVRPQIRNVFRAHQPTSLAESDSNGGRGGKPPGALQGTFMSSHVSAPLTRGNFRQHEGNAQGIIFIVQSTWTRQLRKAHDPRRTLSPFNSSRVRRK